jgi:hypothetical protein
MKLLQNRNKKGPKLVFPPILVVNWVSSSLSFFLSAPTAATYIFTTPTYITSTCTSTLITPKPRALNAEFHHFILRFNKNFICFADTTERRDRGWKQAQREGEEERVTLRITLLFSRSFGNRGINLTCYI